MCQAEKSFKYHVGANRYWIGAKLLLKSEMSINTGHMIRHNIIIAGMMQQYKDLLFIILHSINAMREAVMI